MLFAPEEMCHVSESTWEPPTELPDALHGVIGFDLETCDKGISAGQGAGWAWRGGGHVAGYAISADNFTNYLPIGHEGGGNLDPDMVRRWLRHVFKKAEGQVKVGANTMYDLGWSHRDGIDIKGEDIYDIQWAEAILDEYRLRYSLDSLAKDYLGDGKTEQLLREAAAAYGVDPKSEMWKLPAKFVATYAIDDAVKTKDIWLKQEPKIRAEGLWDILKLEHDLIPLYMDMRLRGIRIDVDRVEKARDILADEIAQLQSEINRRTGMDVAIWAAESIAEAFDDQGLYYPSTPKTGKPSINKDLLEKTDHWLPALILNIREKSKLHGTFLEGVILGNLHDGRVHGEIHPLKSEAGGTVTGRLSMSNPNLQFIPTRTKAGKEIRRAFLPEEGEEFCSADISQQEPRLLVHFASQVIKHGKHLPGAVEARDLYLADPDMSYHDFTEEITGLDYKAAKIMNLAIIYGRGTTNTAAQMGKPVDEVKEMFKLHAARMPFVKAMAEVAQEVVEDRGYILSLLGRRLRFPFWEPKDWDHRDGRMLLLEEAKRAWPGQRLGRSRIHKSLNSLIQPSAADQMKMAMRDTYRAGYGSHILIQVHDELCLSVAERKIGFEVADIIKNAVKLEVPVKVDTGFADNWGDAD